MKKVKPYEKPEITRVELRPEEAVLTACKTSAPGPNRKERCGKEGSRCTNRIKGS